MIVFPMVGMSSRFFKDGYLKPKYMLEAHSKNVFHWVVKSFLDSSEKLNEKLLFVIKKDYYDTEMFINDYFSSISFNNYECVILDEMTSGQAETVYLGLMNSTAKHDEPLTIFNIDTIRTKPFVRPLGKSQNYLEVFTGEGEHWSFAATDSNGKVIKVSEKERISEYCSDGLYNFDKVSTFLDVYKNTESDNSFIVNNEKYVAPLYNKLISSDAYVAIDIIEMDDLIFCGVPQEYEAFLKMDFKV
ncbi:hypothetical protein SAMN05518863_104443 [Candidatus Pantoea symbiotica]|uniref:Capsular biosynthesis protein n=1 Tax=Candidatus Pantoea symbiotica TaxID=1884370 RepID=A0A1I3WWN2_9GAMM|nr:MULTISPECIES: hypothetical protein [Pantoea]KAJ9432541.1 capsular biosynthesis protein [Pantoea sp. YR343]SFK11884.1 hypothetical protein SAMN05518863_104443 [Pantoea symbiotica]SFU75975.1 hypothetical protein SAMN05518864_104443 [Pantoea sp. YR525]